MRFVLYQDTAGEWRWRLLARNNHILADSGEGYVERRAARAAVTRIKAVEDDTPVEVVEAEPGSRDRGTSRALSDPAPSRTATQPEPAASLARNPQ